MERRCGRGQTGVCVLMWEQKGGYKVKIKDKTHDEYKSLPIVTLCSKFFL